MFRFLTWACCWVGACAGCLVLAATAEDQLEETLEQRGYRLLTTNASYLPPDFDQTVFDELWQEWEEPLRSRAEHATPQERRQMAFERYGLTEAPERPGGVALQYVDDGHGGWVMTCLACHTGTVAGKTILGAPNTHYALQTLTEEVRLTKLRLGKPFAHMDQGSLVVPLGGSNGTTNAVMFGVLLMTFRDADLNVHRNRLPPPMLHHDHDAPPWWHYKKKTHLYIDGFAPKNHRALMQFLLIPRNGPEKFREWEGDFEAIEAWISSIPAPKYPFAIDEELAGRGKAVFIQHCADCHGTYGADQHYPEKMIPIDEVGTDPIRWRALSKPARKAYGSTWFNYYNEPPTIDEPAGYVAPPLDGVWASAPYFHNGSVPTLWHLLHAAERPVIWHRSLDGYDTNRVGLEVTTLEELPAEAATLAQKRRYFDTRVQGKSAAGHLFPEPLAEEDKCALLEYLKTL